MKAKPPNPRVSSWAAPLATGFGIGHLPWAPGTWASLVTTLFWWFLSSVLRPSWQSAAALLLSGLATGLGVLSATSVARETGDKDPRSVVIDEVAGQLIAFIAIPASWKSLLLGFILFRGFDIVKPPPVRQLEQLPEGLGIVMDDVAAGVYAFGIMQILLHTGLLPK
ncbi:MAG TPA: phosphatidylglycerophosphatase A [Terriglobales bacterium]|nr:phosphatidylglycerophosphatase A [Terriglobales bacterium]